MKKITRRIKKKPTLMFVTVFSILFTISSICLIYSILRIANIEDILRYLISTILILFTIVCLMQTYRLIFKGKNLGIILFGILFMVLFIGESYACGVINGFYNSIDNIYKNTSTYTSSIVVMKTSKLNKLENIKNIKIGMVNDENSIDGYTIPKEIIDDNKLESTNEIVPYDTLSAVMASLYEGEISAAIIPSNYTSMFSNTESYTDIASKTKIIHSKSKTVKKDDNKNELDIKDPFTVLVLGIDSVVTDISKVTSFNADSLMLITFNPDTYNATIVSIPRDTYVPIACLRNKTESKITHSGWYSESCVVQTIEEWTGIDINYYVKINFTGVVNLVDAVDGIEVDVPYSFCEQNSQRLWGNNTVYVEKGLQTLNGEQALALSRNRHPNPTQCSSKWTNYNSSDLVRGQNQQAVINALLNKIVKDMDLNKVYQVLDIISNNMDINMNTNQMLSYYNLAKEMALNSFGNSEDVVTFERLYLSTYGKYIYDGLLNQSLSNQIYYKGSFDEIVKEMKVNLGIEEPTLIKKFSFSINNPYTVKIIGKGTYNQEDISTVPSFKNKDVSVAEAWAKNNGITIKIEKEDVTEGVNNSILKQSIPASYLMSKITKDTVLTVTVANLTVPVQENDNKNVEFPTE